MKKLLSIFLLLLSFTLCSAQLKVNVILSTEGAVFEDKTEIEMKAAKGEKWSKYWEETCKPTIYQTILGTYTAYVSSHASFDFAKFGTFDEPDFTLVCQLISMDEDGESVIRYTLYPKNDTDWEPLYQKDFQKNGNNTKKYFYITDKAFVRATDSNCFGICRAMGISLASLQKAKKF